MKSNKNTDNPQVDSQRHQLSHLSPTSNQCVQDFGKQTKQQQPKELDSIHIDQLHKDINRSLQEKQEQLEKLKDHYAAQESLIENQIKNLEKHLNSPPAGQEQEKEAEARSSKQIDTGAYNYQSNLNLQQQLMQSPSYSYSMADSISRRLQEQEQQILLQQQQQ